MWVTALVLLSACETEPITNPYLWRQLEGGSDWSSCAAAPDGSIVVAAQGMAAWSARIHRLSWTDDEPVEISRTGARFMTLVDDVVVAGNPPNRLVGLGLFTVPVDGGEPTSIRATDGVRSLAADRDAIFWHRRGPGSGGIFRFERAGETVERIVPTDEVRGEMAVHDDWLYWVEATGVSRMPLGGTDLDIEILLSHSGHPTNNWRPLAFDGSHFYVFVYYDRDDARLLRVPLEGGTPETVTLVDQSITALAVGGGYVYWASGRNNRALAYPGQVQIARRAIEGGPIEVMAEAQNGVTSIVVLEDRLVWCEWIGNDVAMRMLD